MNWDLKEPKYHNTTPPPTDTQDLGGDDAIDILLWNFYQKKSKNQPKRDYSIASHSFNQAPGLT